VTQKGAIREIKEWQAIMDHLRSLPVKKPGELPVIPVDERAAEVRAQSRLIGFGLNRKQPSSHELCQRCDLI